MAGRYRNKLTPRRRHFIREWREARNLTQDQLAERVGISKANLSRLENHKQDYSQSLLDALSYALRCEPADLLMRNPMDPEGIWSIWDNAKPAERRQIVEVAKAIVKAANE